ncbi:hypothetical protein LCGC14_2020710 [marine sediment metagenome]|uniref:Bis(5'-nucleosyl)-tetraphosphatase [asymmetrical] n=1 Tax=marine sediment metagenome TaxID=412755 RepID=A0A0F9HUR9_9ZZZZ
MVYGSEKILRCEKSCGAIVYRIEKEEIHILLVQMNRGHWSFPKGNIKRSETEDQTALRELKEETNLEIEIFDGFKQPVSFLSETNTLKDVIYILAKPKSLIIHRQETEIRSIHWFKFEEALDILTYDKDNEILKKALLRINDIQRIL